MNCHHCGQRIPIGQVQLSNQEQRRVPLGGPSSDWNIIKWQVVKAAAMYFDVDDWIQRADTSLSYEENVELMREQGNGSTMREMPWKLRQRRN